MNGILLVDKPEGWTSFDVVAKIRGIVKKETKKIHESRGFCIEKQGSGSASNGARRTHSTVERVAQATDSAMLSKPISVDNLAVRQGWRCKCRVKVGHTGTLDPSATGLLVLCIGKYTKKVSQMIKHDKTYEVEIILGKTSTTGDKEGEISNFKDAKLQKKPEIKELEKAIEKFVGNIMQTPPVYSALKINGKRAYQLAREGKEFKIAPRQTKIYSITNIEYDFPRVKFVARVGSGTYIRSLAEDIGKELGVGAYMSALRRTEVDSYKITEACAVSELTDKNLQKSLVETDD
jgi:tRNA pseudouridine55 synthase